MTQAELARSIAEKILFCHVTDIENQTVWEIAADYVEWDLPEDEQYIPYENQVEHDALCTAVFAELDKVTVGISWDGGESWEW